MDAKTLIINPDHGQNRTLSQFMSARLSRDSICVDTDLAALDWLKSNKNDVDIVFMCGEIFRSNRAFVEELKSFRSTQFATLFLLVSPEDKEWLNLMSTTSEVIDNLLIKPFRVKELVDKVRKNLKNTKIKNPSVLVVERDRDDKEILRESLSILGFSNIYESDDGHQAFDFLLEKANEISIVVSDWDLGPMNGVQLLRRIRQNPKLSLHSFLMVASQDSIEQVKAIHAAEVGISGYITKPFESHSFAAQMEALLPLIEKQHKVGRFLKETRVFEERGVVNHAIDLLNHAIKALPDTAAILEAQGDIYRVAAESTQDKKYLTQAAEAYERALKLEPIRTSLVAKCVDVFTQIGQLQDVVRISKAYLFRFGFDDALRTRLGKIYLQNGDYGAACVELRRALSVNPLNEEALALIQIATDLQLKGGHRAA